MPGQVCFYWIGSGGHSSFPPRRRGRSGSTCRGWGGCPPPPPVAAPLASSLCAPSRGDPPLRGGGLCGLPPERLAAEWSWGQWDFLPSLDAVFRRVVVGV